MLTLHNRIASVAIVAATPVRVQSAAPTPRPFARFLTVLLLALGAMHA
jgi:hypothetical protein